MRLIANIPKGKEKEYKRLCKQSRKQVLKNLEECSELQDTIQELIKTGKSKITIISKEEKGQ